MLPDLANVSNDELRQMKEVIDREMSIREDYKRRQMWQNVVNALTAYIGEYGQIYVENCQAEILYINKCFVSNEPGAIEIE